MQHWQRLHERVGHGETLVGEEHDFYHATIARWDAAEDATNQARLKQLREKLQRLLDMEAEYDRLRAKVEEASITRRTANKQYQSNHHQL